MANEDLKSVLDKFAVDVIADIKANMRDLSNSALANSLTYEIIEDGEGFQLNIIADEYWDFAQKGHPPGRKYRTEPVKYGLPEGKGTDSGVPFDYEEIIRNWGKVPSDAADAVKWKTIREGSYLYRHPEEHKDFLGTAIQDNLEKLSAEWREKVKDILVNGFSKLK